MFHNGLLGVYIKDDYESINKFCFDCVLSQFLETNNIIKFQAVPPNNLHVFLQELAHRPVIFSL